MRPIAFYGSEKMGVSPVGAKVHVAIAAWPWGAYLGPGRAREGHPREDLVVRAPPRQRHHGARQDVGHLSQLGPRRRSRRRSTATTRACCSTSTASSPRARARTSSSSRTASIYEPELTSALTGITRASVIELAAELGYEVSAKRLTRDDIYIADEALLHRHRGRGDADPRARRPHHRRAASAGPVTKAIQKAFFDVVTGKDKKRRHWLTPVGQQGRR